MLAEILVDIPLPEEPRLELGAVKADALASSLEELELHSLARQVASFARLFSAHPPELPEEPSTAPAGNPDGAQADSAASSTPTLAPQLITTPEALAALMERLMAATDQAAPIALDTETTALNPFQAELVGVGLCWGAGPADLAYIPIGHLPQPAADLLSEPPPAPQQLPLDAVLTALAPWLASPEHPKTLQNAKYDRLVLLRHGLPLGGVVMDTLLADYLRDANAKHGLEVMAERNFGFSPTSYGELVPKGATFAAVPIEAAAQYCGMDVHVTWRLTGLLRGQLAALGPALAALLEQVELPLEPVLAAMEAFGVTAESGR